MSGLLNNSLFLSTAAAAAGPVQIERSLRFNSSDSGFCSRTPAVAGNRKKFTYSTWAKLSALGTLQAFFSARSDDNNRTTFFYQDSQFKFQNIISGSAVTVNTSAVFRDPSAWYHILLAVDTDQGTSSNRVRLYVNGVEQTLSGSYPGAGDNTQVNNTVAHAIGRIEYQSPSPTGYFDGYLADIYFIDGQALTPSSFTEVSATTGQLIPKAYTGTFTGNSFWLKFSDNSSTTSGSNIGIGKDFSGLGNYWNSTGLSVTAGAGNDSLVDTPTSYGTDTGAGGEVRGNYCTLNPLKNPGGNPTSFSNGNLETTFAFGGANFPVPMGAFGVSSGKWYWEITPTSGASGAGGVGIGIGNAQCGPTSAGALGVTANGWAYYYNGNKYNNNTSSAYGVSYTNNDIIGVALDCDNGTLVFYKNGVSQGTAYTGLTSGPYFPAMGNAGDTTSCVCNFGQRAFAYQTPGTNRPAATFLALVDTNLPAPVNAKPNTVMDAILYSGNSSTQSITSLAFSPDLVWSKCRNVNRSHRLSDAVRGSNRDLYSDATYQEVADGSITAFTANGFNLDNSTGSQYNTSGETYVSWCWDAGSDVNPTTNTQGSITSSVRANASAGFSIVTFTGTGTTGTVGHGLGVAPSMYIIKRRDFTANWYVYHTALGNTGGLGLNLTNAFISSSNLWNNTSPTSSVLTVSSGSAEINANGGTYVLYCFAPVSGYSAMGSYISTGTTDNVFNFCNFRPRFLLIKNASVNNNWFILDSARSTFNAADDWLGPNSSSAEDSNNAAYSVDFLSNGFKVRSGNGIVGNSGDTVVWAAFAESPFAYARAR